MKLIIAGGRNYKLTKRDFKKLDKIKKELNVDEVVSGGAKGADFGGEIWADKNELILSKFIADWSRYGKSAGPKRNKKMAEYADAVILFPGGKGTNSMYQEAKKQGIIIYDQREIKPQNKFKRGR